MRDAKPQAPVPACFRTPFVGHLPGYLTASEATALGRPDEHVYNELLMTRWRALLDSPASREERLLHAFLERHPSLLPGSATVDGDSGHAAYPLGVITSPKLPGLSDREPDFMWLDFMWLATDSESLYPVMVEIELRTSSGFTENAQRSTATSRGELVIGRELHLLGCGSADASKRCLSTHISNDTDAAH